MFCEKCGKEVNNDAVVCIHCGCSLKKSTEFFGFELTPRLATHPDILKENKMNLSKRIQKKLKESMNSDGFPKINKGYYENYHS